MRLIAHRGNTEGPNKSFENCPEYIKDALIMGFDVEIDVWVSPYDQLLYLGHDKPQYEITYDIFNNILIPFSTNIWFHCKNDLAFLRLVEQNVRCGAGILKSIKPWNFFFHNTDDYTITSIGIPWVYPGKKVPSNGVWVLPEFIPFQSGKKEISEFNGYGICSDYVNVIRKMRNGEI